MDQTHYHTVVETTLETLYEKLGPAFEQGTLQDLELQNGVLTLITAAGSTLVISRHSASKQLWLASPLSGGLHFSYDTSKNTWQLADGRTFTTVLTHELRLHQIELTL